MSYLPLAELKRELPFSSDAFDVDDETEDGNGMTEWDRLLERLLDQEADRIDRYAETRFVETETSATLYGDEAADGDDLPLPNRPVVSVTSIDADGTALDVATDVRVRETHVELLDDAPISNWPSGPIAITWTYGYSSVPGPVQDGLVRLVRSRLDRIQSDGLKSESLPSGQSASYRPPEEVLTTVAWTVAEYRPDSYGSGTMVI